MKTLLLLLALTAPNAAPPRGSLREGVVLSQNCDYEASEKILSQIKSDEPAYLFYRMINAYRLNNKEGTIKWADSILYNFGGKPIPQRYLDMATILRNDVEFWKDDRDDLSDIAREMQIIQDRLKNMKGGKDTQAKQKDVADRLKKMIDKIEDDQKKAMEAAAAAADEKNKQRAEGRPTPPPEAPPGGEQGPGEVDRKRVREIAEVWGKLPEKECAKAMRELTRAMPAKDRAVIEKYFQELQKRSMPKR